MDLEIPPPAAVCPDTEVPVDHAETTIDPFDLATVLQRHGQRHLLDHLGELPIPLRGPFLERIGRIDWAELVHPAAPLAEAEVSPTRVVTMEERLRRQVELERSGRAAYAQGAVAVLMVAGGQGTRLGLAGPKGCLAIGSHSGKSIYQIQSEKVAALARTCGRTVPFLIMTSPMTDAATREFFAAHGNFGLPTDSVRFFSQGTVPSLDREGQALLEAPGRLLENPDGHGGCFTALIASGELDRLGAQGVTHLVYLQVDNILAPIDDPVAVGLAIVERAQVLTKVLEKAHPDEKVGHLVRVRRGAAPARDAIIEYTELTPEQCRTTTPAGELIYRWGSPAMHVWEIAFLEGLGRRGYRPPLHRSAKPLKAWQAGSVREVPGWKSERFIFDLVSEAERTIGLAIDRAEEFAPVKNASGSDSPESARRLAHDQFRRWLEAAGVTVEMPPQALIEISPLFAATRSDFLAAWDGRTARISGDFYLEGR